MKLKNLYIALFLLLAGLSCLLPDLITRIYYPMSQLAAGQGWEYFMQIWTYPAAEIIASTPGVTHTYLYCMQFLPAILPFAGTYLLFRHYSKTQRHMTEVRTEPSWAKLEEIQEFIGKDGVVLTEKVRLHEAECYEHVMVVGPTGSGKTASYFMPNILQLLPHQSTVIFDPKGEIYLNTSNFHRSQGRNVKLLKLDEANVSLFWNPLDVPKDMVQMAKVCKSIIKNKSGDGGAGGGDQDMWDASAEDLLIALVYVAKSIPPGTFGNFRNISVMLSEMTFEAIIGLASYAVSDAALKGKDIRDLISRSKSFSEDKAPEATRNSTRFVLKTALAPFQIDSVALVTAASNFAFESLKEKPTALFISMPEHKVDGVKPVLATMYMQLFDSLLDYASLGSKVDPAIKKRPIFFFLDEFANCGKILGFTNYIATIRSRQLSVSVCLQSPEQLKQSYSDAETEAIKNNLKTVLILPGLKEEASLKYFQEICGDVGYMSHENMETDKKVFERRKLPMAAIRELDDNRQTGVHEAIVILKNKPPIKDRQCRYYQDPGLLSILKQHPQCEFIQSEERVLKELKAKSFLEPADIELLEAAGTFIYYKGSAETVSQTKKTEAINKFSTFLNLAGNPTISVKNGELSMLWPKQKDQRGMLLQIMVTQAFKWMHKEKILEIHAKK